MFKRILISVLILASTVSAACQLTSEPATSHFGSGARKILFIGNSLTAFNDMPAMVVALADAAKWTPGLTADVWARPDYALIDHWNDGFVKKVIADGHYDVVVLQQGPSSVEVNRDTLRLAAKLFAPGIRSAGGIPALFSVWPTAGRLQDFDRATQSYQLAAQDVNGMHFPGGETWRAAWRKNGGLGFFSDDGLHPSGLGSYAVALSIVGMLYDRSVVGLPNTVRAANGTTVTVDTATARLIQLAADEANKQFGSKGTR
jgi:hypothetical protein